MRTVNFQMTVLVMVINALNNKCAGSKHVCSVLIIVKIVLRHKFAMNVLMIMA